MSRQLSHGFGLDELCYTSHRNINNNAPPHIVRALKSLCDTLLEPIRERFGAQRVTSGYRCAEFNLSIGGSTDSAHLYGCAADIQPLSPAVKISEIMRWLKDQELLPFDQVIDEMNANGDAWLHVGALRPNHEPKPRRQLLKMRRGTYYPWTEID